MSNTDVLSSEAPAAPNAAASSGAEESALTTPSNGSAPPRKRAGLSGMVLAELRELAGQLGITGTAGLRKGDLIAAIKERQGGTSGRGSAATPPKADKKAATAEASAPVVEKPAPAKAVEAPAPVEKPTQQQLDVTERPAEEEGGRRGNRRRRSANRPSGSPEASTADVQQADRAQADRAQADRQSGDRQQADRQSGDRQQGDRAQGDRQQGDRSERQDRGDRSEQREQRQERGDRGERRNRDDRGDRSDRGDRGDRGDRNRDDRGGRGDRGQDRNRQNAPDDGDEEGGRRGRRFRDRRRRGGRGDDVGGNTDTEVRDDDVLLPVAGILDVLENYAFVRTSGYLAGPNDVYVSLSLVRKYGLRRGDALIGAVRQPRDGEQQRQKFNPLVRVDKINGLDPEESRNRPDFTKLTPLYPNERLRLETEPHILTTRVIDLVMPIGKGQRALVVSPPKAGKTSVLQSIANAITTNNPECHLMVVLVDERPEEVTDMQRSVKGEVIASTFDRPPSDHTTISELAIERAKRLVEMGHDVVVLLDSITRLGRAYNLAAPASGRILSGGVDSTALYPPKRFLGAARNIEGGGSLTVIATALVETGSAGDSVIFEEFKGTGNAELKLDRKIADKRTFPAVDVDSSGTRKEDLLLSPDELAVMHKLRRVLHALDSQQAIDLLLDRLRKSRTNIEFLMQVAKTTPGGDND
ncbi:transcription termination factor Rho [Saccharothrix longispora]|uniref:transcription termination factor Rho n=1 Tax=Saccharothrix longispora TaxID=33920 RepID=UPI0028FD46D4|nr:transcription termination factor Rho [Saccharothrix longispora]MDU0291695.1 transcription termination factor Rho [Saccharothrix longispora]